MDLPNLPAPASGLTGLHLSDLHMSGQRSIDYLTGQLEYCATLEPDLVFLTGDYITSSRTAALPYLGRLLKLLNPRRGAFAVLGNHDYNQHRPVGRRGPLSRSIIGARVVRVLADNGVHVLVNQSRRIDLGGATLQIVGLDDLWGGEYDPDAAFANVSPGLPTIALAHNPDAIEDLQHRPCDWILAGHTHGGQVRLPLIGAPIMPIRNKQYDMGLFTVNGRRLYVSRGLGWLRRIRLNCRPEITLFTLTRGDGLTLNS